jgi:acid phosphatase family membrane protein YuiD
MFFYCFFSVNIILLFGNTGFLLYFIKIYSIIEEIVYEREILKMRIFVVCLLSWFVAQIIKVIINLSKYYIAKKKGVERKKVTFSTFLKLGGMPSSHTATVIALCACLLLTEGINSPIFAASGVFAFITMFDAVKVRLPVEKLTEAFNDLQDKVGGKDVKAVKKVEGHTIPEIIGGFIVGATIAIIMVKFVGFLGAEYVGF